MSHLLLIFFPETPHALFLHSRKERGSIFLGSVQRAVLPNTPYYRVGGATATHASVITSRAQIKNRDHHGWGNQHGAGSWRVQSGVGNACGANRAVPWFQRKLQRHYRDVRFITSPPSAITIAVFTQTTVLRTACGPGRPRRADKDLDCPAGPSVCRAVRACGAHEEGLLRICIAPCVEISGTCSPTMPAVIGTLCLSRRSRLRCACTSCSL